jgi:hypothetical protein
VVEDASLGPERKAALFHLRNCLYNTGGVVPGLPPLDELHARLERIVRDEKQSLAFRQSVLYVIFINAPLDGYLDLAVQMAAKEPTPLKRAEAFHEMTRCAESGRFSEKAGKRFVRLCFENLESINDHRSGDGYSLAMGIGHFLKIQAVVRSQGPFAPTWELPKYQGTNKDPQTNGYFQDTVDNAMKWWAENKGKY